MTLSRTLARWFPVPKVLVPCGTGVDVSDTSVKWLSLAGDDTTHITSYGNQHFDEGIVQVGAVKDPEGLARVLVDIKKKSGLSAAHAALPEEGAYVFTMYVPHASSREQIRNMIEFELENRVPIPLKQAVYDFDTIDLRLSASGYTGGQAGGENGEEIAVTVFPRDLADGYVEAFHKAGINLVSLEIEARSIARAISSPHDPVTMLVDSGKARTGVAILKRGIPIFTSTTEIGGDHLTRAAMEALGFPSEEKAEQFKNEHGLIPDDPKFQKGTEALEKIASQLAEEVAKHYRFWDTRRAEGSAETSPLQKVYLLGGSANLRGFPEYIAGKVHVETERPNVWRNLFSFDDYIPSIEDRTSFQYATAIGLALRSH